ncbi:hypothetical protein [Haladaptatus pallidirubidus]|uniref:hypothetical protein n=1 Tax=Haladaptatus pallidirubidus TaxID=1008152 RepID=UPI001D0F61C6|nr:hypothetical protein [Haladaptatus pallidirubidus]
MVVHPPNVESEPVEALGKREPNVHIPLVVPVRRSLQAIKCEGDLRIQLRVRLAATPVAAPEIVEHRRLRRTKGTIGQLSFRLLFCSATISHDVTLGASQFVEVDIF